MSRQPEISVIIPTFNEEKYIPFVLDGLKDQTFKNFETIVVDANSSDSTRKIAKSYSNVKVINEKRKGIGLGRNTGAWAAKGKLLVFLDADTKPTKGLLEAYRTAFKDKSVIAATGPIFPLEKSNRRTDFGFKFVSVLFVKASIAAGRPSIVGLNFANRKKNFENVNGFDESLSTYEDWDLSLRMRKEGRIIFVDDALVHTSTRRIKAWGIHGFFLYHVGNMFKYHLLKKPSEYYEPIR